MLPCGHAATARPPGIRVIAPPETRVAALLRPALTALAHTTAAALAESMAGDPTGAVVVVDGAGARSGS